MSSLDYSSSTRQLPVRAALNAHIPTLRFLVFTLQADCSTGISVTQPILYVIIPFHTKFMKYYMYIRSLTVHQSQNMYTISASKVS